MYFAYVDETGTDGNAPVMVMVGILANAERITKTTSELAKIFSRHSELTATRLTELKARQLFAGGGPWRTVAGDTRRSVVSELCQWLVERKHELALAAIDLGALQSSSPGDPALQDSWQAGALHMALQLQRLQQTKSGSKGLTVLVFDDNKMGMPRLAELVFDPPPWTDNYYGRHRKRPPLDRLVDTPFAVKSHHVGLVQVADIFAHIFRRHSELTDFGLEPRYSDEPAHYAEWVGVLAPRLIPRQHRWPVRSTSDCAKWYSSLAPRSLSALK